MNPNDPAKRARAELDAANPPNPPPESTGIARACAPGGAATVLDRAGLGGEAGAPPEAAQNDLAQIHFRCNAADLPFTLTDDEPEQPSWHRRHDDVCPIKRAFWHGACWGWAVGVVMTAAAVAWRLHGTLLP